MLCPVFSEQLGLITFKKIYTIGANNMVTLINSLCNDISFSTLIHESVNTKPIKLYIGRLVTEFLCSSVHEWALSLQPIAT
jgi:hypothetical protein